MNLPRNEYRRYFQSALRAEFNILPPQTKQFTTPVIRSRPHHDDGVRLCSLWSGEEH